MKIEMTKEKGEVVKVLKIKMTMDKGEVITVLKIKMAMGKGETSYMEQIDTKVTWMNAKILIRITKKEPKTVSIISSRKLW